MAYFVGHGDTAQLDYIVRTLKEKLYIRDGITTNDEVKIPSAEVVNYWVKTHSAGNSTSSTPGAKQEFAARGLKRCSVPIEKSEQLSGVIPGVNIATVSANTVNAYVVDGTIEAANRINRDYLTKLEAIAETKTVTGADVYAKILALRAEFVKVNGTPAEDKAASYIEPTAMFVSPKVMAELKRQNLILYKDNDPMGSFLDMTIIEAPNLTNDVVMLHKVAMISGISFNAAKTFDASVLGYADGVAYIGEIAYVNKATELDEHIVCEPVMAVATL